MTIYDEANYSGYQFESVPKIVVGFVNNYCICKSVLYAPKMSRANLKNANKLLCISYP